VVPLREDRNHAPARVASVESGCACAQALADDAEELLSSVQQKNFTRLLWSGCQTQVAEHTSVAMLLYPTSLARYLSFRMPARDIDGDVMHYISRNRSSETRQVAVVFFFWECSLSQQLIVPLLLVKQL